MLRGGDNDIIFIFIAQKDKKKFKLPTGKKKDYTESRLQIFVLALAISPVLNIFHISVLVFPQLAQIMPKVSAYTFLFVVTMQQNG